MTLDLGITAVSLPEIRADFDDSKRQIINWGATSYLVTMTSLLLLFGRLSDRYGRRKSVSYTHLPLPPIYSV